MSDEPWWVKLLMAFGIALAGAAALKIVKGIVADVKLAPEDKLARLDAALKSGQISKEEWQKGRDSVMSNYASHA